MNLRTIVFGFGMVSAVALNQASAQTVTDLNNQVTTMNNLTSNPGQSNVVGKISSDFTPFLGSDSTAVVTGLRQGTPITLTSLTTTPGAPPTTTTTVITPPTGQMGFGNVYTSLALAKQQLSTMGITQPTPDQLQAALTGGTITQTTGTGATATTTTTELQGILTMRSQNMGWGQIAQKLGFKLGPVISQMKSANHNLATATPSTSKASPVSTSTTNTGGAAKSGIVTGSGKQAGAGSHGAAGGTNNSSGIVSTGGKANGNAYGVQRSGIVTGSGSSAGSNSGVISARGNSVGAGHGKGPNK